MSDTRTGSTFNFWIRSTAFLLLLTFGGTNAASPAPSVPVLDAAILSENPFGISVPEREGRVTGFYSGENSLPIVIHLQDAHGNLSAQRNLEKIIARIASEEKTGSLFVLVEGAQGFVGRAPLTAFLKRGFDPRERLLAKGMVNGPELASLQDPKIILWGIESPSLYDEHLAAWAEAVRNKERNQKLIGPFKERLRDLLFRKSPPELRPLLEAEEELRGEEPDLAGVTRVFRAFVKIYRRELLESNPKKPLTAFDLKRRYPNVYRLMQLEALWEDARSELEAYQRKKEAARPSLRARHASWRAKQSHHHVVVVGQSPASGEAPQSQSLEIASPSAKRRSGGLAMTKKADSSTPLSLLPQAPAQREGAFESASSLVQDLYESVKRRRTTANVKKYLRLTEEIDRLLLLREISALLRELKSHFYREGRIRRLDLAYEKMALLEKLIALKLTPQETTRLKTLHGPTPPGSDLSANERYYELAQARDAALFSNLQTFLRSHPDLPFVFLFTGGFHAPGLAHALRVHGVSYLSIQPAIDSVSKKDDERYTRALLWQTSTLAIRTALSVHPAALVHEVGIPFLARRILESEDPAQAGEAYERAREELLQAYDEEIRETTAFQLREAWGLEGLDDPALVQELARRRAEFFQALEDLRPVFEQIQAAKEQGLVRAKKEASVTVELPHQRITIRPYDETNPVTNEWTEPRPIEFQELGPVDGMLKETGEVVIHKGLDERLRESAIQHELRGHVTTEYARRYKSKLLRKLVDSFNRLPAEKKTELVRRFYEVRIQPFEEEGLETLSRDASVEEIVSRIVRSKSVTPNHPEIWQKSVTLTLPSPPGGERVKGEGTGIEFSDYFVDEVVALFLGMSERPQTAQFELREEFRKEPVEAFFSLVRDVVSREVELLRDIGYFESEEAIRRLALSGVVPILECSTMRLVRLFSAKREKEGKSAGLIKKLFGVKERSDAADKKKKREELGELRYWMHEIIDRLKKVLEDQGVEILDEHAVTHGFEKTWFNYMLKKGDAANWSEKEFLETLVRNIIEESPDLGEDDLEEIMKLIRETLEMTDDQLEAYLKEHPELRKYAEIVKMMRELFKNFKETVTALDEAGEEDWRHAIEHELEDEEEEEHQRMHEQGIPHEHEHKHGHEHKHHEHKPGEHPHEHPAPPPQQGTQGEPPPNRAEVRALARALSLVEQGIDLAKSLNLTETLGRLAEVREALTQGKPDAALEKLGGLKNF